MELQTYADIKTKLQNDLDVQDLDFINGDTELLGYINEAIDDAESIIHTLGIDSHYFLKQTTITASVGSGDYSEYSLPTDIFANKIRKLFFINGSLKYEVFRIRDLKKIPFYQSADDYEYVLVSSGTRPIPMKLRIYPASREAGSVFTIWYIRNAYKMTSSEIDAANVCEIPEAINFVYQHAKMRIYEKMGNPNLSKSIADLGAQKDLMVQTLQEMVPDENTEALQDFTFYQDSILEYLFS